MNPMIMQLKMEQARLNKEYQEYRLKLVRIMSELAALINPYFSDIEEIPAPEIEQAADELLECRHKAAELEVKLRKINRELGDEKTSL